MTHSAETITELYAKHGNAYQVAKELGVDHSSIAKRIRRLGLRGAKPRRHGTEGRKYVIIPDTQCKPGISLEYLRWIGEYVEDQKPDVLVHLGDHGDMPSLSTYDKGKKSFEGRRYKADVAASVRGMETLMAPIKCAPELHLTLGNHEHRINRAANDSPEFDGLLSVDDLQYEAFGWTVYPYLKPVTLDGIVFCHFLTSGVKGLPITTANALLTKGHMSAIVGHQQGRQVAYAKRADGGRITGIIAGSCYTHDEEYMGYQGNPHWRGLLVLHEVIDGTFDEMFVSINYLQHKYGR